MPAAPQRGGPIRFDAGDFHGPATDAPRDRRMAGREQLADVRADRGILAHILEVQAIADDTAATKLTGRDLSEPGELTHDEIGRDRPIPTTGS